MLIRKENEIEIWTDEIIKGEGKKTIIVGIFSAIIFPIIFLLAGFDFQTKETYIFLAMLSLPGILILICGKIFLNREKEDKYLIAKINEDFIEITCKKENKNIKLDDIDKIKAYNIQLNIFYSIEGKKQKYSFKISPANRGLIELALKEYKKDIIIQRVVNK